MHEGNLTRFGPETYQLIQGKPTTYRANFKAIEGPATLKLHNSGVDNAWITVNGQSVVEKKDFGASGEVVLPLTLKKENTIEVRVPGLPQGQLGVRITQTWALPVRSTRPDQKPAPPLHSRLGFPRTTLYMWRSPVCTIPRCRRLWIRWSFGRTRFAANRLMPT